MLQYNFIFNFLETSLLLREADWHSMLYFQELMPKLTTISEIMQLKQSLPFCPPEPILMNPLHTGYAVDHVLNEVS